MQALSLPSAEFVSFCLLHITLLSSPVWLRFCRPIIIAHCLTSNPFTMLFSKLWHRIGSDNEKEAISWSSSFWVHFDTVAFLLNYIKMIFSNVSYKLLFVGILLLLFSRKLLISRNQLMYSCVAYSVLSTLLVSSWCMYVFLSDLFFACVVVAYSLSHLCWRYGRDMLCRLSLPFSISLQVRHWRYMLHRKEKLCLVVDMQLTHSIFVLFASPPSTRN